MLEEKLNCIFQLPCKPMLLLGFFLRQLTFPFRY
nr:MAG TPA: hypothetical protein [Caudoviricetes sp.]